MKKFVALMLAIAVVFVSSVFVAPLVSATDVCSNDAHSSADYYVETSRASWLMGQSCVDSAVITTMPQGSVMHVIGKTEGWHKLVTEDGNTGWMWEDYVTSTNKTFNPVGSEPEPTPQPEPIIEYVAMRDIGGHKYEDAIWYVYNNEIVGGYPDGSYKPDQTINRAELLKIIVEAKYTNEFDAYDGQGCFTDVPASEWYAKYVCFGEAEGIVEGYADGSFKPAQQINFVEALKIAMVGFGHEYTEGDPWYENTVNLASPKDFIPLDIYGFNQAFKRGQMAELITRMMKYNESSNSLQEYLGENGVYRVTYETIDAGLNIEGVAGTGQCVDGSDLYDDATELVKDECTTCFCDNGNWLCTGLCIE